MRPARRSIRRRCMAPSDGSSGPSSSSRSAVYYLLPFVRWHRGPNLPDQAVLVDLPHRRFYFFFIELWPQEVYYFTGLLILAAMALFLMNAVAGRVWCGYLCPQTVWTDLFYAVERWVEGDRRERMSKDKADLDGRHRVPAHPEAHDLDPDRLVDRRRLGALFRRRADPGARARDLPGALDRLSLDRHPHLHDLRAGRATCASRSASTCAPGRASRRRSPTNGRSTSRIGRDRGEPRMSVKKAEHARERGEPAGDCVDCNQCVAVCPTGRGHPQRPAARLHPVRPVHRRLRHRHAPDRAARAAHRLRHRHEHRPPRQGRAAGLQDRPGPHRALRRRSSPSWAP